MLPQELLLKGKRMNIIDIGIIVVYLAMIFGVGFHARKNVKSVSDFLTGGEGFGTFYLVGTIMATLMGAGMLLSMVGATFQYGSGMVWNYIGFAIGLVIFALVFAVPIRKTKRNTMAEIIADRFGRLPRFVAGILAALYAFCILAIGVMGMSRMLVYIFGNAMNSNIATVIAMVVSIALTAMGGLYSVVWTDTMQFLLMLVVVVVLSPLMILRNVSVTQVNEALISVGGSLMNPMKNVPISYILMGLTTMCFSVPGDPTVPQRTLAGKSDRMVKRAFLICAVLALVFGFILSFVGGGAVALLPDIVQTYGTTEAAYPVLIIRYFPPIVRGIGISALMAAVITTATSMLLVGTTHLVYDVGQSLFPRARKETLQKWMPASIVVFGIVTTWCSMSMESIASVLYLAFSLCGAAFYIPMFCVLYWKKVSKWGITLGMLSGALYVLAVQFLQLKTFGGDPVYVGLLLSLITTVGASLLFPSKDSAKEE